MFLVGWSPDNFLKNDGDEKTLLRPLNLLLDNAHNNLYTIYIHIH